ncbi:MAG: hydroxymethylbilane synthase [Actinomycetota bacterium]
MAITARQTVRIGTRGSRLALIQTEWVIRRLRGLAADVGWEPAIITTTGDRSMTAELGTGVFVQEIEHELLDGRIDLAVHSLKDLPTESIKGLTLAAIPLRADPRDALVGARLESLHPGARVGTGSPRRQAQLRRLRPDLEVLPIRGNVPTRVEKARSGEVDAVMLAAAGLARLDLTPDELFAPDVMIPAPGQGALAVQARLEDEELLQLVAGLDDFATRAAVTAERAVLRETGGGCMLPVAAYAEVDAGALSIQAAVTSSDGARQVRVLEVGEALEPLEVAARAAERLLQMGALELLRGDD